MAVAIDAWVSRGGHNDCAKSALELLEEQEEVIVTQKVEFLELISGFETKNKYVVRKKQGLIIFMAFEESSFCSRYYCGTRRSFRMTLYDSCGSDVISMYRYKRCATCWCLCCLQRIDVDSPPGNALGSVRQQWSLCKPWLVIRNARNEKIYYVKGPCYYGSKCCCRIKFKVLSKDKKTVGYIIKHWTGIVRELFTDSDVFGIKFPSDADGEMKILLLGALFLIDYMFFEEPPKMDPSKKVKCMACKVCCIWCCQRSHA